MTTLTPPDLNTTTISCKNCEVSYHVKWDDEDLEPLTCPFCGHEFEELEDEEVTWINEDDSWN